MMTDREKIAILICLGTDDSCKEHCNLPSSKVCVRCETLSDCLITNGVAVQKYGRWEGASGDICSVCGAEWFDWGNMRAFETAYCPNCGAKMDLEE